MKKPTVQHGVQQAAVILEKRCQLRIRQRAALDHSAKGLLGHDMNRIRRRGYRLDPAFPPERLDCGGAHKGVRVGRQKKAVPVGAGAAARPSEPLQKRSHLCGSVYLDYPVEISYVNA